MIPEPIAIIDLGTNTFHLLIAEVSEGEEFVIREKYKEPVQLGEGGINSKTIKPAAFRRGIRALKKYQKLLNSKGVTKVFACATSAIRSAENGKEFVEKAKAETGIDIRVINGNEEASLIFEGVKNGVQLPYSSNTLLVDIGGGSVEFTVCKENKAQLLRSLDIGAARLLEDVRPSDPITKDEIVKVRSLLSERVGPLIEELREFDISLIIGSSGSFETIGAMVAHEKGDHLSAENLNSYRFTRNQFLRMHKRILRASREERLEMPGMEVMRVDMIVMASLIVEMIVTELQIDEMGVSTYALKEGILYHHLDEKRERMLHLIGNTSRNLRAKSIRNLGKKYRYQQEHGLKVSELALNLFDQLKLWHAFGEAERELLRYAALLHDIGHFVNRSGHHKHGQYIIMHSGLSGFSSDELLVLGNIVRYHRKGLPTRDHFHFKVLKQQHRNAVRMLAGILRIADNLDRGHRGLVTGLLAHHSRDSIEIIVEARDIVDIEVNSAMENRTLLEQVLGAPVLIHQA